MQHVTFIPAIYADKRIFKSLPFIRSQIRGTFIRFINGMIELSDFLAANPDFTMPTQFESGWYIWARSPRAAEEAKQAIVDILTPPLCLYVWHISFTDMPTAFSAMAYSKEEAIDSIVRSLVSYHKYKSEETASFDPNEQWADYRARTDRKFAETVPNTLLLEGCYVEEAWETLVEDDGNGQSSGPDTAKILAELRSHEPRVHRACAGFVIFSSHLDG